MYRSSGMPGHLIRRLHQLSTQVFMTRMREAGFDLTPVQFAALDALSDRPGTDQARLAQAIGKDKATVGAVADRLEQKGLVTRQASTSDKRALQLTLTPAGEDLLEKTAPIVEELQKELLPGLNPDEYRQFIELATKAARAAGVVAEE
ncbi:MULTISPECIES: MarR family transcriptional regulator [unclassified Aminobacter]|uniref:MarR family winged helix-turn-helix transcriptional regulator n=1 Tax=unclassified Aminobacter TaxID=2644704 RepID=UPI000466CD0C|nr:MULTISPECIES: MarR family transcriptional regulator [unclassified Aminobacter]TWG61705.1 DNA-binding MarR family transcriptional regulator [Aminobacter sp. J44]TWH31972.1 DNA-binding MarR family transcriptional regulator [Aminobacter sp. J15]